MNTPSDTTNVYINYSIQVSNWYHNSSGISPTKHLHLLPNLGTQTGKTCFESSYSNVKTRGHVSSKSRSLRRFNSNSTFYHMEVHPCVSEGEVKTDRPSSVIHL